MPSFTTRVELHRGSVADYGTLHVHMTMAGFKNIVRGDSGTMYQLPPGEYDYADKVSRAHVLDLAKAAAAKTGRAFAVLVTESAGRTWTGLQKA